MKEFFNYFFGKGDEIEFTNFSLAHFIPLILLGVVIFLIIRYKDKIKEFKHEKTIRMTLAFMLIICEMSYFWRLVGVPSLNPNPVDHLPITVCGWAVVFASYLMVTKSQTLFDIIYFWLFAGSIFALLTPTVITYTGPTRFRYYQFWIEHIGGFIAIFYMIFVHKMRPHINSIFKSYGSLVVLCVIAFFANQLIGNGANYLYMARPEAAPSILDILPPNFVLRLIIMAVAITALYGVAYLPWYLKDKRENRYY